MEQDLGIYYLKIVKPTPSIVPNVSSQIPVQIKEKKSMNDCWILCFDESRSKMDDEVGVQLQNPKGKRFQESYRL